MSVPTVQNGTVVRYRYTVQSGLDAGWQEGGDEPLAYLHGAGEVLQGVEEALEGQVKGAKLSVTLPPEKAFGPRLPDAEADRVVQAEDIDFADELEVGDAIDAADEDGELWVKALDGATVTLTSNHPLSGQSLDLELEVVDLRPANEQELEAGLAFGWSGDEEPDDDDDWGDEED